MQPYRLCGSDLSKMHAFVIPSCGLQWWSSVLIVHPPDVPSGSGRPPAALLPSQAAQRTLIPTACLVLLILTSLCRLVQDPLLFTSVVCVRAAVKFKDWLFSLNSVGRYVLILWENPVFKPFLFFCSYKDWVHLLLLTRQKLYPFKHFYLICLFSARSAWAKSCLQIFLTSYLLLSKSDWHFCDICSKLFSTTLKKDTVFANSVWPRPDVPKWRHVKVSEQTCLLCLSSLFHPPFWPLSSFLLLLLCVMWLKLSLPSKPLCFLLWTVLTVCFFFYLPLPVSRRSSHVGHGHLQTRHHDHFTQQTYWGGGQLL